MKMPLDCKVRSQTPELVLFVRGYGVLKVKDIDNFGSFFKPFLQGKTPFKILFDIRTLESTSMSVIKSLVEYMISFESLAQGKVVASSVLVGPTIENWLKLLFSLKHPTTPTKVTSNIEVACDFLNKFDCFIESEK